MSELVTYAYAVARDADGLAEYAATLTGVGESVALVTSDRDASIVLVVSRVGADDFQESALKRHLEDMAWLEAVARAHHSVIDALATRTDVLPLRLATVYLDNARAREVLDDRAAVFDEQLTRLAGHIEWGVKIYADPSAPTPAPPRPKPALCRRAGPIFYSAGHRRVSVTRSTGLRSRLPSGWKQPGASSRSAVHVIVSSRATSLPRGTKTSSTTRISSPWTALRASAPRPHGLPRDFKE